MLFNNISNNKGKSHTVRKHQLNVTFNYKIAFYLSLVQIKNAQNEAVLCCEHHFTKEGIRKQCSNTYQNFPQLSQTLYTPHVF